jgi:hypothetical protein
MGEPRRLRFYLMKDLDNGVYYYVDSTGNVNTHTDLSIADSTADNDYIIPDPVEWASLEIDFKRNTQYWAIFRSLTKQFTFVNEAAFILQHIKLTQGISGVCIVRIQAVDYTDPTRWAYTDIYIGNIDFSKANPQYMPDGRGRFIANMTDGNLVELINAYGNTPYNIPMLYNGVQDPDAVNVLTDGCKLTAAFNFVSNKGDGGQQTVSGGIGVIPTVTSSWLLPAMNNVAPATPYFGNDIVQNNILIGTESSDLITGNTQVWIRNNYMLEVLDYQPGTNVSAYLAGSVILNGTYAFGAVFTAALLGISNDNVIRQVNILYQKTINNNNDTYFFFEDATGGHGGTVPTVKSGSAFPTNVLLTSKPAGSAQDADGLIYVLAFNISGSPVGNAWSITFASAASTTYPFGTLTQTPIQFNCTGPVIYPPSMTLGFRYYKLWQKFVSVMAATQGNYGFPVPPVGTPFTGRSDFLATSSNQKDNDPYNTIVTSGNALRKFNNYNFITTTLTDIFNDASFKWMMGMGVEGNVLRLEPLSYFFDSTTMLADLTDIGITDFQLEEMTDIYATLLTSGYASQSFNQVGALDDYNVQLRHRFPQTRIVKSLERNCPFVTSIYQIEKARANQQANNTLVDPTDTILTDSEQDNQVFLLEADTSTATLNGVTGYKLKRYTWSTTSGTPTVVPSVSGLQYPDTAFNIGLTPKRNLLRCGPLLRCMSYPFDLQKIIFQTSDATGRLLTDLLQSKLTSATGLVDEYADINISDLPQPLFLPILARFNCPTPKILTAILNNNTRGYIKIKPFNTVYKGYLWDAGLKEGDNSTYNYAIALLPDTDISSLQFVLNRQK